MHIHIFLYNYPVWCSVHPQLQSQPSYGDAKNADRVRPLHSWGWLQLIRGPTPCASKIKGNKRNTTETNMSSWHCRDKHKYLGSILSPGTLFIMLLWTIWNYRRNSRHIGGRCVCDKNKQVLQFTCHADLVVVSSLLDELVDYLLSLLITFLLQVSDECVQVARTVVRLYNRLMSLNNTSNACKRTPTYNCIKGNKDTCTNTNQSCNLTF